jgi:hypothetical protein
VGHYRIGPGPANFGLTKPGRAHWLNQAVVNAIDKAGVAADTGTAAGGRQAA